MIKSMKEKMKNRKGFTLVELVVVIAILGILAAIAVPKLMDSRTRAANAAHNSNVAVLESAASMFIVQKGVPANDITWTAAVPLTSLDYIQKWPTVPTGADATGTTYTVLIKGKGADEGKITVTPVAVPID